MPPLPNRAKYEKHAELALASLLITHQREVEQFTAAGRPVPASTHDQHEEELAALLLYLMTPVFRAQQAQVTIPGLPPLELDRLAVSGAEMAAHRMAGRIVTSTRSQLLAGKSAADVFTARGARMASVELITNASAQAKINAVDVSAEIRGRMDELDPGSGDGIMLELIWRTEGDDSVCPVCSPLEGQPREVWGREFPLGPQAHPGCRCELEPEAI